MTRYMATATTRDVLVKRELRHPRDFEDFVADVRAQVRSAIGKRPGECVGFVLTFHPLDACDHEV
jgi:hypothetical protein